MVDFYGGKVSLVVVKGVNVMQIEDLEDQALVENFYGQSDERLVLSSLGFTSVGFQW